MVIEAPLRPVCLFTISWETGTCLKSVVPPFGGRCAPSALGGGGGSSGMTSRRDLLSILQDLLTALQKLKITIRPVGTNTAFRQGTNAQKI